MRNIINKIKQNRAADRAMREQLDTLTDPHFFTIAEFAKRWERNTGQEPSAAIINETRALMGA